MSTRTLSEIALAISTDCCAASVSPRAGAAHVERDAELGEDRLGILEHLAPADDAPAVLVADEDVLRDVEVGEEQGLLIDRRDAEALGFGGAADRDRLAGEEDLATVRLVDSGDDLDEGRLAGAVLAEERVHLARIERQRNVLERLRRAEALGDVPHLEDGRGGASPSAAPTLSPPQPVRVPRRAPSRHIPSLGTLAAQAPFRPIRCALALRLY